MKSDTDAAKLDELKRLLRRLDKVLPPSPADETRARGVRSRSAGVARQGGGTALRTIALAGGVSLIVSFAVAMLIFHDTPRRLVAAKAPGDSRQPPKQRDRAVAQGRAASIGDISAAIEAESPQLQTEPLDGRQASSVEVAVPLPSVMRPAATVRELGTPPLLMMETGGVAEAASGAVASREAIAPAEPPTDSGTQSDANRRALVELDAAQFMHRGMQMLSRGSIGTAQLLLERAADLGSGDAAFALASTYDGAPGAPRHGSEVRPNAGLALRWYARAEELGSDEARKRLADLKSGGGASSR